MGVSFLGPPHDLINSKRKPKGHTIWGAPYIDAISHQEKPKHALSGCGSTHAKSSIFRKRSNLHPTAQTRRRNSWDTPRHTMTLPVFPAEPGGCNILDWSTLRLPFSVYVPPALFIFVSLFLSLFIVPFSCSLSLAVSHSLPSPRKWQDREIRTKCLKVARMGFTRFCKLKNLKPKGLPLMIDSVQSLVCPEIQHVFQGNPRQIHPAPNLLLCATQGLAVSL